MPNVTIKRRTKFEEFILDDTGRVIGILAKEKYRFDSKLKDDDRENKTGKEKYYKAKKGVVMASGGFSRDISIENNKTLEFRMMPILQINPELQQELY